MSRLNFTDRPILVIGDVILDEWVNGISSRLSPEAAVPVISVHESSIAYSLGGAANVAANIKSLGGNPVLIGVLGSENRAFEVHRLMKNAGIGTSGLLHVPDRPTTIKTRVIANGHQVARIDRETAEPITDETYSSTIRYIEKAMPGSAAVVISDYAKGVISYELVRRVTELARVKNTPVFVDPKVQHRDWYKFNGITAMTPNYQEALGLTDACSDTAIDEIGFCLLRQYIHYYSLVTLGERGMHLFYSNRVIFGENTDRYSSSHLPSVAVRVFDVSGAGDTVIAALTLAYTSGYSFGESAKLANAAAGVVVGKHGTATVTRQELEAVIS